MSNVLNISSSPHVRDRWTTPYIMRVVFLSLVPATLVGIIVNGWNAFGIVALAIVSAVAAEWVFNKIVKKPDTIWDGSAVITGLLLALSLGPKTPLYIPVIGSVFAIVVCKGCFGGLGKNFINPALAARCFLLISFANVMAITGPTVDGVTSATPVYALKHFQEVNITSMFLGTAGGVIGGSILALLIGGLVLWSMDIIHGQICFPVLIGFTLIIGLFGGEGFDPKFLLAHLCGGGVVMGAFFMATDYVTSPVSRLGQFIYGCLIGILGGIFRLWGKSADSFSYAIIIGNVCTPLIDTYIVQKPFAYRRGGGVRKEKSSPWSLIKPVLALTVIAVAAGLALSSVYSVTKDPIQQQEMEKKTAAYRDVCPDAKTFEYLQAADDRIAAQDEKAVPYINEFYVGKAEDGSVAGYAVSVTAKGFGGNVTMAIGLTPDGTIQKIAFTELSETAGLGMRADEDAFKDQLKGKSGEVVLVKGDAGGANEISALSGATITSTAVTDGVNAGLAFFDSVVKGGN